MCKYNMMALALGALALVCNSADADPRKGEGLKTGAYNCNPYTVRDWHRFVSSIYYAPPNKVYETLCKSTEGRDVPKARFGCIDREPRFRVMAIARHDCADTMGNFMLEGVIRAFLDKDAVGEWLRENVELLVAPFANYDAVFNAKANPPAANGQVCDYGKLEAPELKAVGAWIRERAKGRLDAFIDCSCNPHGGAKSVKIVTPFADGRADKETEKRFSRVLEMVQCGGLGYDDADDLAFGKGWNVNASADGRVGAVEWAGRNVKGLKVARSFALPGGFTAARCQLFGKDVARALKAFLNEEKIEDPVSVCGIYPSLAMYNLEGECGTGALVPWAGSLWAVTYGPHCPIGGTDKLYQITGDLRQVVRPESVGGTHANRMLHRESGQAFLGLYMIDEHGSVRKVPVGSLPGRLTGVARHIDDPKNKIYVTDMEEALYEIDVNTLKSRVHIRDGFNDGAFKRCYKNGKTQPPEGWDAAEFSNLFGYHGKGTCSGFGKVFYSNNGVHNNEAMRNPVLPAGALAEWKPGDRQWTLIRTNQFTEISTRDGVWGNEHPGENVIWAMGWDAKSVILTITADGKNWHDYRLPKASHSYDGAHGWNTEWPRIREVGDRNQLLATMHGTFWRFPASFAPDNACGIRPRSNYLKVIGDFCGWKGKVVLGCDDSAKSEFLNKRKVKGKIKGAARSHSNLQFLDHSELDRMGPPIGHAFVWNREKVAKGAVSDRYLAAGYDYKWVWVQSGEFDVEVDEKGNGTWKPAGTVKAGGNDLSSLKGEWMRFIARQDSEKLSLTIDYRVTDGRTEKVTASWKSIALADGEKVTMHVNAVDPYSLSMSSESGKGYRIDSELRLSEFPKAAEAVRRDAPLVKDALTYDAASVLYVDDSGARWRLPYGTRERASFAGGRVCREICTERDHFNAAGIYYELPAINAHGFACVRPVTTHNLPVNDYCSWRGMFVYNIPGEIRMTSVDSMWNMGKVRGFGGPWLKSEVEAGVASDAYLLNGFDRKSMTLESSAPATFTMEVDIDGWGTWVKAGSWKLEAGKLEKVDFPAAFSGYWLRMVSDRATSATAQFVYE